MKCNAAHPFWFSLLLLALALLFSVAVGSVYIPPATLFELVRSQLFNIELPEALAPFATIIFTLRLPRTALVAITGAALAGSGAAYQGLFRNPLADPYLIGVASGAGLGAIFSMTVGLSSFLGMYAVPAAAFAGAMLTVWIVYELARVGRALPATNLILAGVAISSFATALTSFLMISATGDLRRALTWMLGGSSMSGWQPVLVELPYVIVGLGVLLTMGHALNVMQVGDEQAQQLGLPVERVRFAIIIAASLATAAAVSFTGIIGFVGLIVPHVVRMVWGTDYRRLIPLSILSGATLLLFADILARIVMSPQELPVGIIMSLGGAPFFLWVLRRTKNQNLW
ncbi:MAG: iron ABC transporter permease [Chloroflexi bacterium]|nr:iron ABC transporter permease [Chloroflexota bacterium]